MLGKPPLMSSIHPLLPRATDNRLKASSIPHVPIILLNWFHVFSSYEYSEKQMADRHDALTIIYFLF